MQLFSLLSPNILQSSTDPVLKVLNSRSLRVTDHVLHPT